MARPLEFPEPLTEPEQREYERQLRELADPRFHEAIKCGEELEFRPESGRIRHAKFHRQYCVVHKVLVDMSGYEIGFSLGTVSKELCQKSSV